MATENKNLTYMFAGAEDLNGLIAGTGHIYKGIALNDRKLANNGSECSGILIFGAKNGEHSTLVLSGVSKFVAGGAIGAGKNISCTTSGYFIAANSGLYIVGKNLDSSVASGAVGTGFFDFSKNYYATNCLDAGL